VKEKTPRFQEQHDGIGKKKIEEEEESKKEIEEGMDVDMLYGPKEDRRRWLGPVL